MPTTSTRIRVDTHTADILSDTPMITDWVGRYFGGWWNATAGDLAEPTPITVHADVDPDRFRALAHEVREAPHDTVSYARAPLHLHTDPNGVITGYGADDVAYRVQSPRRIVLVGTDPVRVASAASRLLRETLRGHLAQDGWCLLHSSAAVDPDGHAVLAFGGKGAGKTSGMFQLAAATGWGLLANDRVFARLGADEAVEILPWPAAAAIGLGFLDAMGWYPAVAAARDELHTSTTDEVRHSLAAGKREPIWDRERELKPQFYPDQITTLCGLPLASHAIAAGLLFPAITPTAVPGITGTGRDLSDDDTFAGKTEDRYPDVWKLAQRETAETRTAILHRLNQLPRHSLLLSHQVEKNKNILIDITSSLTGVSPTER